MGDGSTESMEVEEEHWLPRVEDRSNLIYRDDDVFSEYQLMDHTHRYRKIDFVQFLKLLFQTAVLEH